jgi:hypothetical protein
MKKLIFAVSLIFLVGIFSSVLAQTKITTGKFSANSSSQGYTLDKNQGERSFLIEIAFPKPFDAKPLVVLTVTMVDADKGNNTRYSVEPVSISRDGFTVKVTTWSDSKLFGIAGSWLAYTE